MNSIWTNTSKLETNEQHGLLYKKNQFCVRDDRDYWDLQVQIRKNCFLPWLVYLIKLYYHVRSFTIML